MRLASLHSLFDVRPNEVRCVTLCFAGAFLVMSFMTLARAMREALFLTSFGVEGLPYITAAVALLSIPTVAAFTKALAGRSPRRVLAATTAGAAAGLGALWPLATGSGAGTVLFYLWTALGALLLSSGFWIVTSELFAIRGAKRTFGLIGAGGTAGAMAVGASLNRITSHVDLAWLVPGLILILAMFYVVVSRLPSVAKAAALDHRTAGGGGSARESLRLLWSSPHLKTIALIVLSATMASTMVDFQFKDWARSRLDTKEALTAFLGAFYGWAGAAALVIQLTATGRIISGSRIGRGLSVLPALLFLGSFGLFFFPGLAVATAIRGGDNSLRRAIHRPLLEILYVPVRDAVRRKTKTFIDSIVDSLAEGMGALVILVLITLPGLPSRYLSIPVALLSVAFIFLARRMDRRYVTTLEDRLKDGQAAAKEMAANREAGGRDLLSASFTRLDLRAILESVGEGVPAAEDRHGASDEKRSFLEDLRSPDPQKVARALDSITDWGPAHVPELIRLLARDPLHERVSLLLMDLGPSALDDLITTLEDESGDFVIRRRIPRILAQAGDARADDVLIGALTAGRFEIRYRAAIALARRRKEGLPASERPWKERVWSAIRKEVGKDRPVWELQKLLDDREAAPDGFVSRRVGRRGDRSLEHTFRLLSLVLDTEPVQTAFHGVILNDEKLKSFALEYLEQALPADIKRRLWPFIGDASEVQQKKEMRPLGKVVDDLMDTGATLFASAKDREELRRMLEGDAE